MGFSLVDIISKFVPTKRVDDDLRENPFNTAVGQEVTSVEENYWARKLRYGKTAFKLQDAFSLPASGSLGTVMTYVPRVNKIFIPDVLTFSADVDVIFKVNYVPYANYDPFDTSYAAEYLMNLYIPAKTPFVYNFTGGLEIGSGGSLTIQATPQASSGKAYSVIHGIEVSNRA